MEKWHPAQNDGQDEMDAFYEKLKHDFTWTGETGRQALMILSALHAKSILSDAALEKMAFHVEQDIRHGDINDAGHLAETLDALTKAEDPTKRKEVQDAVRSATGIYFQDPTEK